MSEKNESRRSILGKLTAGIISLGIFGQLAAYFRSLIPNILYEPPTKFKIGLPTEFSEGVKFIEDKRVYIFKERNNFYAISAVCTHLGCTVKHSPYPQPKEVAVKGKNKVMTGEFRCPCHGSNFYGDGTNYAGPAPAPLVWHPLEIAQEDGQILVDISKEVGNDFRLSV